MLGDLDLTKKLQPVTMSLAKPNRTQIASLKHASPPKVKVQHGNIYELQFDLPYYIENQQHEQVRYKVTDIIRNRYLIKLNVNNVVDWYVVYQIVEQGNEKDIKTVYAYSLAYQLRDKRIRTYKEDSKLLHDVATDALSSSNWAVGTIDSKFTSLSRSFDVSSTTVLDFIFQIAETFGALVQFDTDNKLVNFLDPDSVGQDKGLIFSYKKYLKSIQNTVDDNNVFTRLRAYGNEDLTFNGVNPTGQDYIDNYSFYIGSFQRDENKNVTSHSEWMSDGLCNALLDYQDLINLNNDEFKSLLTQLNSQQDTLMALQNDMYQLNIDMAIIEDNLDIAKANNEDITSLEQQKDDKQVEINSKQSEIDSTQTSIDSTNQQISDLRNIISMDNNFTSEQIIELNEFVFDTDWSNTNYTDEQELYDQAVKELEKVASPPLVIDIDIVNFLEVVESQRDWDKLKLGDYVRIKYPEFNIDVKAQIITIDYDFGNGSIKLTIANIKEVKDLQKQYLEKLYQSQVTYAVVDMNKYKFDVAVNANTEVNNIMNNKWDAAKQEITAGVNETVDISRRGIIIKDANDPNKIVICQAGIIALSLDGGANWKTAIKADGIIAEVLIGQIIIGQNLLIQNSAGKFTFNQDGATFDGTSLNIVDNGNGIELSPDNGIIISRSDNKARILLGATGGISIQQNTGTDANGNIIWTNKFYVDTNGKLVAEDLLAKKLVIDDGSGGVMLDANNKTIDFSKFLTILGQISFDNASGGTLTLGGTNNGNGVMEVYDSNGNLIANLDSSQGGFDELGIGFVRSSSVYNVNRNDMTLQVPAHYSSIAEALNSVPKINEGTVRIQLTANVTEDVEILNFIGNGIISLDLNGYTLNGYVFCQGCSPQYVHIYSSTNSGTINCKNGASDSVIAIDRCTYVKIDSSIKLYGQNAVTTGVYAYSGSAVYTDTIEIYDVDECISAFASSQITVKDCKGLGNSYGVHAFYGGYIIITGTIPGGSTSDTLGASGIIEGSATTNLGTATPPPSPDTATTWTATSADNWSSSGFWDGSGLPKQGNWGYGTRTGYWFFGSGLSSTLTGKTIKSMKIFIQRKSGSGYSGLQTVRLHSHNYSSKPSTPSGVSLSSYYKDVDLSWEDSSWVTLPSSFFADFQSGTAKGIGIYIGSSKADYSAMYANAKLQVTYS